MQGCENSGCPAKIATVSLSLDLCRQRLLLSSTSRIEENKKVDNGFQSEHRDKQKNLQLKLKASCKNRKKRVGSIRESSHRTQKRRAKKK
jgi:hypothetical protein